MPRPKANRTYGGNRASGKRGRIYQGASTPFAHRSDPNAEREGFAQCGTCDAWVRLRADGTLMTHRFMIAPCIGSHCRPKDTGR
jgi:hypothetical protein